VISTMAIDRDRLLAQLDDIKSRTRSSIEVTTRLVDQSFLRFKASHRTLYAVHQSQELLDDCYKHRTQARYVANCEENLCSLRSVR
jgi:hypothetical protein